MIGMILGEWLPVILFFGIPAAAVVLFVVSLVDYRKANRMARVDPRSITKEKLRSKRVLTAVLGVIAGCMTLALVGLLALAYMAVAFM